MHRNKLTKYCHQSGNCLNKQIGGPCLAYFWGPLKIFKGSMCFLCLFSNQALLTRVKESVFPSPELINILKCLPRILLEFSLHNISIVSRHFTGQLNCISFSPLYM